MKLYIDLGNSYLKYKAIGNNTTLKRGSIKHNNSPKAIYSELKDITTGASKIVLLSTYKNNSKKNSFDPSLISLKKKQKLVIVKHPIRPKIKINYINVNNFGLDRYIALLVVIKNKLAGGNAVLIGLGTITTIDVLVNSEHQGGYLLSGLSLVKEQLKALLKVDSIPPMGIYPATDTPEAISNGSLLSLLGVVKELQSRFIPSSFILYGGGSPLLSPHVKERHICKPDLIFDGMELIG